MLKRTGARTQPCLTPLLIAKASVTFPPVKTWPVLPTWKSLCSFKDRPKSLPADRVEGVVQINEHRVEWHVLFDTLLLKLTHGLLTLCK